MAAVAVVAWTDRDCLAAYAAMQQALAAHGVAR